MLTIAVRALDLLAVESEMFRDIWMLYDKGYANLTEYRKLRLRIIKRWPLAVCHYRSTN